jgi:NADH pyrophosphatase NudC (nudix superfamily)
MEQTKLDQLCERLLIVRIKGQRQPTTIPIRNLLEENLVIECRPHMEICGDCDQVVENRREYIYYGGCGPGRRPQLQTWRRKCVNCSEILPLKKFTR